MLLWHAFQIQKTCYRRLGGRCPSERARLLLMLASLRATRAPAGRSGLHGFRQITSTAQQTRNSRYAITKASQWNFRPHARLTGKGSRTRWLPPRSETPARTPTALSTATLASAPVSQPAPQRAPPPSQAPTAPPPPSAARAYGTAPAAACAPRTQSCRTRAPAARTSPPPWPRPSPTSPHRGLQARALRAAGAGRQLAAARQR